MYGGWRMAIGRHGCIRKAPSKTKSAFFMLFLRAQVDTRSRGLLISRTSIASRASFSIATGTGHQRPLRARKLCLLVSEILVGLTVFSMRSRTVDQLLYHSWRYCSRAQPNSSCELDHSPWGLGCTSKPAWPSNTIL